MGSFSVLQIVSSALLVVDEQGGYISVKKAQESQTLTSTANLVHKILLGGDRENELVAYEEQAQKIIDWIVGLNSIPKNADPNFWQKLQSQLSGNSTIQVGVVTSSLHFYNQKFTADKFKKIIKDYSYVGDLNNREDCFVKLVYKDHKMDIHSGYYIYKGITRDGDLVLFYDKNDHPITIGDCFLFKGTIKTHEICKFDNVPITKFNRIRFLGNHGQPQ